MIPAIMFKRTVLYVLVIATSLLTCCSTEHDTYVVVVSMDAFRWDYLDSLDTPNLKAIASEGVQCIMEPSYPASTFPNHYSIATGLYPDHHGIVNSSFWCDETQYTFSMLDSTTRYNSDYYLGEPIWVTAENAGIKTACIYWVGADIPIKNKRPHYVYPWYDNPHLSFEKRANEVVNLLSLPQAERPHLVMLYFDEPDETSHHYGPLAPETRKVVSYLDSIVGNMYKKLSKLPYGNQINIIITSDHGMTDINNERFINWNDYLNPSWYHHIVGTNPTNIYANDHCIDSIFLALSGIEHLSVWHHGEVPQSLNYGTSNRTGDVIVAPDLGWQFASQPRNLASAHGYSPKQKDMQVAFIAKGPVFKRGYKSHEVQFKNVDIYPMLAHIFGFTPATTDGNISNTKIIRIK